MLLIFPRGIKIAGKRNTYLREALIESSWVLVKKDPAMLMKYKDYCKRMHKNKPS
jgi:hypothetical protein